MKKIGLICATLLASFSLAGCNNLASQQSHKSSSSSSSVKVINHHKAHKKTVKKNKVKKQSQSSSNSSQAQQDSNSTSQQNSNQQATTTQPNNSGQQQSQGKSLSEINRERGYDPTGAPLLPGQDHAAGANPDGSPDAWVQGQIDWEKQNGYLNPDGSETQKGIQADQEVERDSQPGMP